MRVLNPAQSREPLQPLPAMQRPLTPPESQRKYGGMAQPSSPIRDTKLQVNTREEIDLYDSSESDVEYHDFEDDNQDMVGSSTVKITDRRGQEQQANNGTGWQVSNNNIPGLRSPSPTKDVVSPTKGISHVRTGSQIPAPTPSRYSKSEVTAVRSSATSSTALSPPSKATPSFTSNLPSRPNVKPQQKYNALEDILLPALDEVHLSRKY